MEAMNKVIKKCKTSKSPGASGIRSDCFKWLTAESREYVLKFLNDCWQKEEFPEDFEKVDVITLSKNGNVADPSNFRPIALLHTLYKVYAALIKIDYWKGRYLDLGPIMVQYKLYTEQEG